MPRPDAFDNYPPAMHPGYSPQAAVVEHWQDGDSLKVLLDPGWDNTPCRWLRLKDVSAPELSQEGGPQTRDYANSLAPPGTPLLVYSEKLKTVIGQKMTFSRYVAVIKLEDGSTINPKIAAFVHENGYQAGL